ncbi:uncharacterized protein [Henckelia pumila]|uniref:uncharacterized protein n=1 Tax=Henckelia pumila TaxID=405737 RepID=UPI003C6DF24C
MTMMQNRGINITYYKAWKGKELALNQLRGDPDESFHMLPSYLNMVKQVNPGSITHLVVDNNRFRYMFLAYDACINGYKFMRKVVAVDGTFLKGKYNGVLLVATTQDGEFHQFPIAWGVVDSETVESWTWFMLKLQELVPDDEELVIISDRHQGIISDVANVYKQAHHGYCVWHLSQNIKTRSKQKGATELFMRIAYAYKQSEFDSLYSDMRNRYPQVAKYLEEHTSPEKWSRSHCPRTRYNIMTTNGVESINSRLRTERDLPIVSLLDALQKLTSCWFSRYRNAATASTTVVTPAIESILRERFNASQKNQVYELNNLQYHVYAQDDHETVDFASNSCSCRVYDLDRIPCSHAIAASYAANLRIYDLCSEYYTTHTRVLAYSGTIYPVPQCSEWTKTIDPLAQKLLPPNVKQKRGRRKVNRNPSIGEFGKR